MESKPMTSLVIVQISTKFFVTAEHYRKLYILHSYEIVFFNSSLSEVAWYDYVNVADHSVQRKQEEGREGILGVRRR